MAEKHYTDEDVKAALEASERAKWETMRAIVSGTPEAKIRENVQRAILDAVAPAIAARALREAAADLRDGAEKNPFTEGGRQGILIAADVCEERATALAEVTA